MPWCIEFHQRLVFFRTTVDSERRSIQGIACYFTLTNSVNNVMLTMFVCLGSDTDPTYRSRGTSIRIRKLMSFEDGMNALDHLSVAAMKDRIVIHYINEFGEEEKGKVLAALDYFSFFLGMYDQELMLAVFLRTFGRTFRIEYSTHHSDFSQSLVRNFFILITMHFYYIRSLKLRDCIISWGVCWEKLCLRT